MSDGILVPCSKCDKLRVCVGGICEECAPEKPWNQHEDLPILINAEYFERMPIDTHVEAEEMKRFVVIYAQRTEEHTEHLVRLLSMQGIECQCTDMKASPQCLIHVRDNVPDD
jgi:hypothetical protein